MTANVPTSEIGNARLGMTVADRLRRNRKMTRITRTSARKRVNFTSSTDARMVFERSYKVSSETEAGICERNDGSSARMLSTTSTVFVPGCFWMASTMARVSLWSGPAYQLAVLSFSTLSKTLPRSPSRTGEPLR